MKFLPGNGSWITKQSYGQPPEAKVVRKEEALSLLNNLKLRKLGTGKLEFFLLNLFGEKGKEIGDKLRQRVCEKGKLISLMMEVMIRVL